MPAFMFAAALLTVAGLLLFAAGFLLRLARGVIALSIVARPVSAGPAAFLVMPAA